VIVTAVPGEDFAFFDTTLDGLYQLSLVSAQIALPMFQLETRHFEHKFLGTRRTAEQVASIAGGSLITSLRQLIKRKCPFFSGYFANESSAANAYDIYPFLTGQAILGGSIPAYYPTFLTNAALPFAGYSGSVRQTAVLLCHDDSGAASSGGVSLTASRISVVDQETEGGSYNAAGSSFALTTFSRFGAGADVAFGSPSTLTVSVEVPYVDLQYMRPVPLNVEPGFPTVRYVVEGQIANPAANKFDIYLNAGDDFNVMEWVGVPPLASTGFDYTSWIHNP